MPGVQALQAYEQRRDHRKPNRPAHINQALVLIRPRGQRRSELRQAIKRRNPINLVLPLPANAHYREFQRLNAAQYPTNKLMPPASFQAGH